MPSRMMGPVGVEGCQRGSRLSREEGRRICCSTVVAGALGVWETRGVLKLLYLRALGAHFFFIWQGHGECLQTSCYLCTPQLFRFALTLVRSLAHQWPSPSSCLVFFFLPPSQCRIVNMFMSVFCYELCTQTFLPCFSKIFIRTTILVFWR